MREIDFSAKAEEIMALAEENGVDDNFLFVTTFDRYLTQLTILAELKKKIDEEGVLAEKEYVKGTKNMYAHPAVAEYNKTTDSSNKTVSTLMRIIRGFGSGSKKQTVNDPLADIMNGADDE